jgi:PncC family amidohydrolase
MIENELITLSNQVGDILNERNLTIATAESCTGGLLSHILTSVSGSSGYFTGGIVAYSNRIKEEFLGVSESTIIGYGAVSEQTAREMASGISERFTTNIGLSTTGIAGPTGGTPEKPVGLVWMGVHFNNETLAFQNHFKGDRDFVKISSVKEILTKLLDSLRKTE